MTKVSNVAPQLPPNMSISAAMSAGLLSNNTLIASVNSVGVRVSNPTLGSLISSGVVNPSQPCSLLGFGSPGPNYGGD